MADWYASLLNGLASWQIAWMGPAATALLVFTLTWLSNALFMPRLRPRQPEHAPFVSLLVPARNEAGRIGATVTSLLAQQYPHFELLILDDQSEDETRAVAQATAAGDTRCRLLPGAPLPAGWLGKNWACHQLAQAAEGELFIFVDADVTWQPSAVATLVAQQQASQAEMLSIWPTQLLGSAAERVLVPLINFVILNYISVLAIHHLPLAIFAAANGQCLLFTRQAYRGIGGHIEVRGEVLEDVALARHCKRAGYRLRLALGGKLIHCRMYNGWPAVRDGFAKNLLAGYGRSPAALMAATLLHWFLFVWPWIGLLLGGGWPALLLGAWGLGLRLGSAWVSRTPAVDAVTLPLAVPLMTLIAWRSYRWAATGRSRWKGRALTIDS